MRREIYDQRVAVFGLSHEVSLAEAHRLALALVNRLHDSQAEAKTFLRDIMPRARRFLGPHDTMYLRFRWTYAFALADDRTDGTLNDMIEAEKTYVEIEKIYTRRFGSEHPTTVTLREEISKVRGYIANVRDCATCKDPSCEWGAVARRSF